MSNIQNTIYEERMEDLRLEREQAKQESIWNGDDDSPFGLMQKIDNYLFNLPRNK